MAKDFELEEWYASEPAKRSFGSICQAVNESGATIGLLGTRAKPLLVLIDADMAPELPGDRSITIDEAKADWPAVTTAVAIYGTRFRIQGKRMERAVLSKDPDAVHPAERYRTSSSPEVDGIARQMEALAKEVRKLGGKLSRLADFGGLADLRAVMASLEKSAELIERRFRDLWRIGDVEARAHGRPGPDIGGTSPLIC